MAELLGVGHVMLEQAQSPGLHGGGDLVVYGPVRFGDERAVRDVERARMRPMLAPRVDCCVPVEARQAVSDDLRTRRARVRPTAASRASNARSAIRKLLRLPRGAMRLVTNRGRTPMPGTSCARWTASTRFPTCRSRRDRGPSGSTSTARTRGRPSPPLPHVPRGAARRRRRAGAWPACACNSSATAGRAHYSARGEVDEASVLAPRTGPGDRRQPGPARRPRRIESRSRCREPHRRSCARRRARAIAATGRHSRRRRMGVRLRRPGSLRDDSRHAQDRRRVARRWTTRPAITITTGDSGKA